MLQWTFLLLILKNLLSTRPTTAGLQQQQVQHNSRAPSKTGTPEILKSATAGTPEPIETPVAEEMLATVWVQIHDASNSRDYNSIETQETPMAASTVIAEATETSRDTSNISK